MSPDTAPRSPESAAGTSSAPGTHSDGSGRSEGLTASDQFYVRSPIPGRRTARQRRPSHGGVWPPPSLRVVTDRKRSRKSPLPRRTPERMGRLARRQNGTDGVEGARCAYCLTPAPLDELTRDHIYPRARGGGNGDHNLVLACVSCNSAKGNRTPQEWQPGRVWEIHRLNDWSAS